MPLRVENLSKRFGDLWALRDVSLEAVEGEVFGIFGATAAGKTTLLNCVAGHANPSTGKVSLNSLSLKKNDVHFAEAWKPLSSGLFGRRHANASDGQERIDHFRGNLAGAGHVTLFDEPFLAIDPSIRGELQNELRNIAVEDRIVFFSSSDFEQIAAVCNRVAVIDAGEVQQIGTPREVYENPSSVAVAAAVGVNNLILARRLTSSTAEMPEFITLDGEHRLFAHPAGIAKLGAINSNVTLAVHPEQLSISFGASFPEDNLIKAVVTDIRFLGPTTMVQLNAAGLKLEARVFRVVGLNIGDECMIAIPPDRIQVLKS